MNLVICTGIGMVVFAAFVLALLGCVMGLGKVADWARERVHISTPEWLQYVFIAAMVGAALFGVLLASHAVGCTIVHLTMRHP